MRGALPPLPNTPSWRGTQLKKHRYLYLKYNNSNTKFQGIQICAVRK